MKKLLVLGLSVIYMLILTFCEYSPAVIEHISSEENYYEIEAEVFALEYKEEGYSYIYVNLLDFEHYEGFVGFVPENKDPEALENTYIELKIIPENAIILKENGFFDNVHHGDVISIRTTRWINNTLEHHYVAEVVESETVYLPFETGFDNMREKATSIKDLDIDEILNKNQ